MSVYNRAAPGKRPNWWCAYTITEDLRVKWGLKSRTVREPCGTGDQRAAKMVLAQRRREVKEGSWRPRGEGRGFTVRSYGDAWIAKRQTSGVRSWESEAQRLRFFVWPLIGDKAIGEVRRQDVLAVINQAKTHVGRYGKPLAPRTLRLIYSYMHLMFEDAVSDEVVITNPCTLKEKRGELPAIRDADPTWRSKAVFSRDELEQLISDERIPEVRRVQWALCGLAGLRIGEAVARTWGDYDARAQPLGRLHVHSQHDGQPLKTEMPRDVPVHPTLAKLLAAWKLSGAALALGHQPRPDDLILPRAYGREGVRSHVRCWYDLQLDLQTLGLRRRRVHDLRRTHISIALADGADKYLHKWSTHGRRKDDAFDLYAEPPWAALCEQVAKMRVELLGGGTVVEMRRR